ncbi:MAG: hypothetical protein KAJ14_01225 [Candidatus Omnitrophica bacterium]|nr:hypothetical protein [Candidatus Omnitrophota bacterium]
MCNKRLPLEEFYQKKSGRWKGKCFSYCIPCTNKRSKDWYNKNKPKHLKNSEKKYKRIREEIIKLLGGGCVGCTVTDKRVLCIDHINGDGHRDRVAGQGNGMYYRILAKIKNGDKSYQLLCLNCNWIKAIEKGELKNKLKRNTINSRRLKR